MRKALVHDWIDQYGGAERVLGAIAEIIDFDYYYVYITTMNADQLQEVYGNKRVHVVESDILKKIRPLFRFLMPIFPFVVNRFNKQTKNNPVDLVISSSWALSKSYRIGSELHICYMQARNFKYVWDEADQYFRGPKKVFSFLKPLLQRFDIAGGANPDYLIANSQFVKNWIKEKYKRDSTVIYPPVDVEDFFISDEKGDYFITVGRLQPYKRFDIIIDAFVKNGKKLIVVGDGSVMKTLQEKATENIQFVGFKSKNEIKHLLARAKAFVFAGVEDFGIAIVEALAAGIPVIAYSGGASTELIDDRTGLLYHEQNADALNRSMVHFDEIKGRFDSTLIRESALKFSKQRFQREFQSFVDRICSEKLIDEKAYGKLTAPQNENPTV